MQWPRNHNRVAVEHQSMKPMWLVAGEHLFSNKYLFTLQKLSLTCWTTHVTLVVLKTFVWHVHLVTVGVHKVAMCAHMRVLCIIKILHIL